MTRPRPTLTTPARSGRTFRFLRPTAYAEYTFKKLLNTALGGKFELEHNEVKNKAQDTLIPLAFSFDVSQLYLRNAGIPVFGLSGIEIPPDQSRSHGLDERVPVASLYRAREYWYTLVKTLLR